MPVVEDKLTTAADLITYDCPNCGGTFKDFTRYQCENCEKKFWYETTLDPHWFSKKLPDGSPDWNSAVKDNKSFNGKEWSYGRLNIKTMEYERVPINREGEKWDYLNYQLEQSQDAGIMISVLRDIEKDKHKSAKELKKDVKQEQKIKNEYKKIEQREAVIDEGVTVTERK